MNSAPPARRSRRLDNRIAPSSPSEQPDPPIVDLNDLTPANTQSELLSNPSVYLENNISRSAMEDPFLPSAIPTPNGEPSDASSKSRKKNREERHLRQAVEQQIWLREKFDFPESELLVASFSAALFRHILLQGRMYITSSHICFYTKLFGKVTKEAFPFSKLARVKKRRGGLVANAIKIFFLDPNAPPVVIGSLNHREKAYGLIQDRLRAVNPAAAEQRGTDDDGSGGSVASAPAETDYLDGNDFQNGIERQKPASLSSNHSRDDTDLMRHTSNHLNSDPTGSSVNVAMRNSDSSMVSSPTNSDLDQPDGSNQAEAHDDDTQHSLLWQTPEDVVDRVHGSAFAKKTERARVVLNCTVKEALNELFIGEWLKHYHNASGNRDISFTEWERGSDGFMTRVANFRRPLAYKIGPKETRVEETQRYSFTSEGGVVFELEGQNLDAPYASYFVVESFFELTPQAEGSQTLFVLSVAVNFLKSTMLQGKIETGALTETKTAFQRLSELAAERVDQYRTERSAAPQRPQSSNGGNKRSSCRTPNGTTAGQTLSKVRSSRPPRTSVGSLEAAVRQDGALRSSPSMQDVDANVVPAPAVAAATVQAAAPLTSAGARKREVASLGGAKAAVEVHDAKHTKWMRVATVAALALTCMLLLSVVGLLYRMHHGIRALEKMVADAQQTGLVTCNADTCVARIADAAGGVGKVVEAAGASVANAAKAGAAQAADAAQAAGAGT